MQDDRTRDDGCKMTVCRISRSYRVAIRLLAILVAAVGLLGLAPIGAQPAGAETLIEPTSEISETAEPEPATDQALPGVRDSVVRLYFAVFDRDPDPAGQDYWVQRYLTGTSLSKIANLFISSPEWTSTYGRVDDRRFVQLLYENVLDRQPDVEGWDYWADLLALGVPRATILLGFSESIEFVATSGTTSPVAPPHPSIPDDSGLGRRIVYSNSGQRVWMVNEDDTIHDSYLVSGKRNAPVAGTYHVYSKSPKAWAGHGGITMEHMVRFAWGKRLSIGFHSIPRYSNGQPMQEVEELGTFQSAGCVRQRDDLALALYEWAPVGTLVVVLP